MKYPNPFNSLAHKLLVLIDLVEAGYDYEARSILMDWYTKAYSERNKKKVLYVNGLLYDGKHDEVLTFFREWVDNSRNYVGLSSWKTPYIFGGDITPGQLIRYDDWYYSRYD